MAQAPATPPEHPEIPDKLYFRIGEVARLAGVKPYVLRYWESEFSILEPKKSGSNHRLYRRKDVEAVLEIKALLYEKRYTIEGARKHMSLKRGAAVKPVLSTQTALFSGEIAPAMNELRRELKAILKILSAAVPL